MAGGKIHSDIERGFIRVEVTKYDDFIETGSEKAAKEQPAHEDMKADKAKVEPAKVKEDAVSGKKGPTAVLTYYEGGTKTKKDVPYLDPGTKIATLATTRNPTCPPGRLVSRSSIQTSP